MVEQIVVRPNGPLHGTVRAGGAKNSALKLMVACLLTEGRTVLSNVPLIDDVGVHGRGAAGRRGPGGAVWPTATWPSPPRRPEDLHPVAPYELVERMRASVVVLGLLLARCGEVHMPLPGGDDFGDRPIDFHVNGLTAMGARFEISHGEVRGYVEGGRLVGTKVVLEYPSHTATDNLLMAAVLAKGTTVIENAAKEPEVIDLAAMLCAMGAVVRGAGTSRIEVEGVDELHPARHAVVPDRVVAATFVAAAGMTGGDVTIADARPDHMEMLLRKVNQMGVVTTMGPEGLRATASRRLVGGRRGHAALPGRGDRLQPAAGGHADRGRRGGDPHREPLLGPVPLRRGAAPHGGRHQDRGAPCRRARRAPPVRGPGAGPGHPGRGRPGAGRAGGRGGDHGHRGPPHQPGLRGPGWCDLRSLGATVTSQ